MVRDSYKTRHRLALLYEDQGRAAEAEAQWRAALEEQPDFIRAWLELGELCLAQSRWEELEQLAQKMESATGAVGEATVLRARGHLARKEYVVARKMLEDLIAQAPQALWPRRILSHAILQEGQDWAAAEKALRDVLALAPDDREARNNLAVLLRQQGKAPDYQ